MDVGVASAGRDSACMQLASVIPDFAVKVYLICCWCWLVAGLFWFVVILEYAVMFAFLGTAFVRPSRQRIAISQTSATQHHE